MAYVSVWISNKVLSRFIFISDSLTVQHSPASFKFVPKINFNLFIEDFIESGIKLLYGVNTRSYGLVGSNNAYLTINIYILIYILILFITLILILRRYNALHVTLL